MAGELVASAVVKELVSKLGSGLWSKLGRLWNFSNDLEDMKSTLQSIGAVLSHAEKRSFNDEPVRLWLKRLKAAAYDIEDMLDELPTHNRLLYSPFMANKLKGMKKRLDKIAAERNNYSLRVEAITYQQEVIEGRENYSTVNRGDVLGREKEAMEIINMLLSTTSDATSIIPIVIVGLGGLGKTTLAKLIFNDDKINKDFGLRIWVHAADFNVEKLAEAILSSAGTGNGNRLTNLEAKTKEAREVLDGKKFLIVLDDVWNENKQKWVDFKEILQDGKKESKIVVTTRSERVSSIMDATEIQHKLKPLSYDVCLELFERRAFGLAGAKDNHLASIGKEIVKKCQGVPLTANALGGMLHFQEGEAAWKKVRDSDIWELKEEEGSGSSSENEIMPSLKLSYQHMPSPLKLCFVYCSSYPRAFKLDKDMLIQQWIAQRFIQTEDEVEALQIGDSYVNYLLSISFLEEEEEILGSRYQNISRLTEEGMDLLTVKEVRTYMKMHDLVHDLARWVAGDEVSLLDSNKSAKDSAMDCRYVSVIKYNGRPKKHEKALPRKVRALHFLMCTYLPKGILSYAKCLRVLDFTNCSLDELPTSIYKLKQLRYLRLPRNLKKVDERIGKLGTLESLIISSSFASHTFPTIAILHNLVYLEISYADELLEIPYSIGSLQKLNNLKLFGCYMLRSIPESLGNLVKLTTLTICQCKALTSLPESVGNLVKLATLTIYDCTAITSLPESLRYAANLKTLDIRNCSRIERLQESLGNLVKLETLDIRKCSRLERPPESLDSLVKLERLSIYDCIAITSLPEYLRYATNLKTLDIRNCSRIERLQESLGNLVKLESLDIRKCSGLERLPESLDSLVKLEILTIYDCIAITSLPESLSNAANLKTLAIRKCCRLKRLPESLGNLVKLKTLTIYECNALVSLPESLGNLVKLETLTIYECWAIRSLPESLSNLVNLKTLAIGKLSNFSLPVSIGELHNLINLDLSFSDKLMEIPDSIGELQKLYSLKLYGCDNLGSLPESLGNLKELRTLDIQSCAMLDQYELPQAICNMKHLKIQRDEPSDLLEFDTSKLELHFIEGPTGGDVVRDVTGAKRTNLKERGGSIKSLSYKCGGHTKVRAVEVMVEALQPHQNLQEFQIYDYGGSMFPSWMRNQMESFLPNLVKIKLTGISNCEHLPVLGQLPKLEEILIQYTGKIRRISEEFFGARNTTAGASFPSLKRLELRGMDELEEWVTAAMAGDEGERGASLFPCLEDLTISGCFELRRIHPCIPPSVRRLSLSGNNLLHLLTFLDVPEMPLLKHLDIYNHEMDSFPESIRCLTSLETLKLRWCESFNYLSRMVGGTLPVATLGDHKMPTH